MTVVTFKMFLNKVKAISFLQAISMSSLPVGYNQEKMLFIT